MNLYSIKDFVSNEFGPVFSQKNDGTALRAARDTLSRVPPHSINDFGLFGLGELDIVTGQISPVVPYQVEGALFFNPKEGLKAVKGGK